MILPRLKSDVISRPYASYLTRLETGILALRKIQHQMEYCLSRNLSIFVFSTNTLYYVPAQQVRVPALIFRLQLTDSISCPHPFSLSTYGVVSVTPINELNELEECKAMEGHVCNEQRAGFFGTIALWLGLAMLDLRTSPCACVRACISLFPAILSSSYPKTSLPENSREYHAPYG